MRLSRPFSELARRIAIGFFLCGTAAMAQSGASTASSNSANYTVTIRERTNVTEWFAATPVAEEYAHQDSLLRFSLAQQIGRWDYQLELGQSAELALPSDAVSPIPAQGQLGLGGTYFFANSNNNDPAAVSFRQGFMRYNFEQPVASLRVGRFEFFDGQETTPHNYWSKLRLLRVELQVAGWTIQADPSLRLLRC
jgi:hypothetical protein